MRTLPSVQTPDQTYRDVPTLARYPNPGAQRRARIEVNSPAARTLPSVRDPDQTNGGRPDFAKQPDLGAQRRTRIEFPDTSIEGRITLSSHPRTSALEHRGSGIGQDV
jgi:hypothetical protein